MKMYNNIKKHTLVIAASFALIFTQFSCSRTDRADTTAVSDMESGSNSELALNNYKNYVSTYETDVRGGWDSTETDWDSRMTSDRQRYDSMEYAVTEFESTLDENQRAEYDEYRNRYQTAWQQREGQYSTWLDQNRSTTMSSTNRSAGMTSEPDMSVFNESKIPSYTATDIRNAYEEFVAHVEANKAGFSNEDWNTVEKYWNQLDDRKNAIQSQLSDKDKWEIAKAKTKYITMKNASKAGNTASNLGSDAKEVGKDVASGTKEVSKDVAKGAKKAGKAVGNTAKKAGQKVEEKFDDDDKQ